jgi:hypothetical protein
MRETVKVVCVLFVIAAIMTSALAWADDRPNQTTWVLRLAPIAVAIFALIVFLRLHFQRDLAPDYLRSHCGTFFDRTGLCFAPLLEDMNGVCVLHTYFQNRYERPCVGRIALRPAKELFRRPNMDTIAFEVNCDGGAFGLHRMAIGIPPKLQGRWVKFEVGASAQYPEGRGHMLRFRDGISLRADTQFKDAYSRSVTIAGAFGGAIVLSRPASVKVKVPENVAEHVPAEIEPHIAILWRPGDEPL